MSDADLRAQIATLTAERDQLRARVAELAPTWRRLHAFDFELLVVSEANEREHHLVRAKRAKRQRETTLIALTKAIGRLEGRKLLEREGRLLVCLTRLSAGRLDDDNLAGAFKHVRDEIARWLGCDDNPGAPVRWSVHQEPHKRYRLRPMVRVEILGPEPTAEDLKAALKTIEALGVHRPPRIDFYDAPELAPGALAVLVDGEPAGWMSGERFAEFKRRASKEGL